MISSRSPSSRDLVVIQGIVTTFSSFIKEHPGGIHLIKSKIGKDSTTAFFGGVYDHSNAAQNLLATMRVGVLDGGYQLAKDALAKIKAEQETAQVDTEESVPALTRSNSNSSAEEDGARTPNEKATAYITPAESFEIKKHKELGVNVVAQRSGGKVGRIR